MKKSKFSLLLVLTLVLSMFLAACSGDKDKADGDKDKKSGDKLAAKQELRVLETQEMPTMNSIKATDTVSFTTLNNTQEGLYRQNEKREIVNAIADGEPTVNAEGTEFTVKLKSDLKWANGDALTAKDFVFAWQQAIEPKNSSTYGPYMMDGKIVGAKEITQAGASKKAYDLNTLGVKAPDDTTLVVQLEKPMTVEFFKGLMAFPTFYPINQKFYEAQGTKYGTSAETHLSNGPFKLAKWNGPTATEWVYEKNENYRDAKNVTLTKATFNVAKDTQAPVNAFEAGETDITPKLSSDIVPQYEGDERMVTWLEPSIFWLKLNEKDNPVLSNVNIRKAIGLAINKEDLASDVLNNGSIAAYYAVPKDFVKDENGKDFRDANGDMMKHDKKKAKEYWEKGLKELKTDKVELRYLGDDSEGAKKIGQYVKDQLEKNLEGLTIKIEAVPFAVRLDRDTKQNYDIQAAGWSPDYIDPISFSDLWVTNGQNNKMSFSNAEYDKYIEDANNTADQAKRWELLQKAEKLVLEDQAAVAPLYQRASNLLVNPKVKGFTYHTVGPEYSYQYIKIYE
ncbi:peptide ABC transporter substrate-binding protein [Bacillus massiliigorillae]|uniref:peptide ABC transporter substrate-binding protein n=1 Tax=Bacillus massiliigorillae TaxID=1243664 RepID=UPI000399FA5C|nr:peptide ABC transporter substrate-binding protein [Bacillus massiliigorillae]